MSWMDRWRRSPEEEISAEDQALVERAQRLRTEIEPGRDLWLGIENQLRAQQTSAPEPNPRGWLERLRGPMVVPGWAVAAFAGLLIATTIGTTLFLTSTPSLDDPAEVRALADSLRSRDGVADVRRDLRALLEDRGEQLPEGVVAAVEANLAQIDRAIAEIHLALRDHPDTTTLQILLADAYRQEAEILEQLEWWTRAPEAEAQS